jgi:hypothetical protein
MIFFFVDIAVLFLNYTMKTGTYSNTDIVYDSVFFRFKKMARRYHLLLNRRWGLLPSFFMSNEPVTQFLEGSSENFKKCFCS